MSSIGDALTGCLRPARWSTSTRIRRALLTLLVGALLGGAGTGCVDDSADGAYDAGLGGDAGAGLDAAATADASVGAGTDAGDAPPSRWLALEGVINARDVGGYAATGQAQVRWRRLLRGGELSGLTAAGCAAFEQLGVATVVDLRAEAAQAAAPAPACVTAGADVVSVPMPKLLPASEDNYLRLMNETEAEVRLLFETLGQAGAAPVYVHCVIGRDRASYAVAVLLLALGADRAAVLADYRLSNDAGVTVQDAHLEAVLDAIDTAGGIEAWLDGLGVSQTARDALRGWALP
jgi:protein-tyrosine phosphatase